MGEAETFGNPHAQEFVAKLIGLPHAGASDLIIGVLRRVEESGEVLDATEADQGRVAVALLLAEQAPSVLDGAPTLERLRSFLADLDTELTPARRTLCNGVVRRILLPDANEWYAGWPSEELRQSALASVRQLADLLADD